MAARQKGRKFSMNEVLEQVSVCNAAKDSFENEEEKRIRVALSDVAKQSGLSSSEFFVSASTKVLLSISKLAKAPVNRPAEILSAPLNPASIFQHEARLWLSAIRRRLSGRKRLRNPFYGEITRDLPFELFSVLVRLVKATPEFCEPFCYCCRNNKGEVISFTTVQLVVNFLSVLTGYGEEQVFEHFKRSLTTGLRKGHKVSIITSDVKDFALFYKRNQGRLVISFNFGEWNASGFPQHC